MTDGYGRSTDGFGISRTLSAHLIVDTALKNGITDKRQIAYILATAQHETDNFTAPDEHYGRRQARKLGYDGGEEYFGRGYVHLTHLENYNRFDALLGLNGELVRNPTLAKEPEIAAKVLVIGMRDGLFTGKRLDRYINEDTYDPYNARRVVNGVTSASPWSIRAAEQCQEHADSWEKSVPAIVDVVKSYEVIPAPFRGSPNASSRIRKLQLGDVGFDVARLQESLGVLEPTSINGSLAADGHFGGRTQEAIAYFQQLHGLPTTGVADETTLSAMQVAVRAVESVEAASKFGQEFLPSGYRTDWLDRDTNGLPNYLRTSHLSSIPSTGEPAAAAERSPAHPQVSASTPPHRSGPAHAAPHHTAPPPAAEPTALPPLPTTQTLEPGDRSAAVLALQQHLQLLGATDRYGQKLRDDKEYGERTRDAVEQFQLWTGREPTGIADPGTLQALQSQAQFALRQRGQGITIAPEAHLTEQLTPVAPNRADAAIERQVQGRDYAGLMPFSHPQHPQHALYANLQERFQAKGHDLSEEHLSALTQQMHRQGFRPGWEGDVIVYEGRARVSSSYLTQGPVNVALEAPTPTVQETMQAFQDQQLSLAKHMESYQQQSQSHSHGLSR